MQRITISKSVLLPIVVENKNKHNEVFNLAVSGYWQKAENILSDKLEKVKNKERIENSLGLSYPVSYENDYNRVIRMLELTNEKEIDLSSNEFDQYVRNEWSWKNVFISNSLSYATTPLMSGCMMKF